MLLCSENGYPCAKYFSPLGKKFSSFDEISQYFNSKNYSVPKHLFKFDIDINESESDEEDLVDSEADEDDEDEIVCAKRRKSDLEDDGFSMQRTLSPHQLPTSTSPLA